ADDALRALRAALSRRLPEYHGPHYDFAGMIVEPHAVQAKVPLWIGGRTKRSLRRAVELADGWVPFGLSLEELRRMLDTVELPDGFQVVLSPGRPLDPGTAACRDRLARVLEAGATTVSARIAAKSADHYREQLEALAELGSEV
ncbi:LLM class flavin-dependent oxidoreductase, partial [Amycolatopsis sp. NPDC000740]